MKKIPTLFEREYENHKVVGITDKLTDPAFQDILDNPWKYDWTIKFDGTCCCVMNGIVYKRYDAKRGKKAPEGAIPCCDPDPITGHHPHWVEVNVNNKNDKYIIEAFKNTAYCEENNTGNIRVNLKDATYEAVGPKINGNPYGMADNDPHIVLMHGCMVNAFASVYPKKTSFEEIRGILKNDAIEGFVIWKDNEPLCKIKRSDFGFKWPIPDIMEGQLVVYKHID